MASEVSMKDFFGERTRIERGTSNDHAIATALQNEEEEEMMSERRRSEINASQVFPGEEFWGFDDRRGYDSKEKEKAVLDKVIDSMGDFCVKSVEIASRVARAGVQGVVAVTPKRVLPVAQLQQALLDSNYVCKASSSSYDDRLRLLQLLKMYELIEIQVQGDGNCQFRALSQQIYGTEREHEPVRERVISQLTKYPLRYRDFIEEEFTTYVATMSNLGSWGDHVTLQAAADAYGLQISLLTSYESEPLIEIKPEHASSQKIVWLTFWHEVHYNAVSTKV